MGVPQILMMIAVIAALAGYWWFKYGRIGGAQGYLRKQLGLRDGEQISGMWAAYYDIDRTTADKVGEVFGVHTRGINVMLALTTAGRLAIGDNEKNAPPMGFERGQVAVSEYSASAEMVILAGQSGMEKAMVMMVTPASGTPFRLQISRSGFEAIQAWSRGA